MPTKKRDRPDEKLPLKLSAAKRKLVLNRLDAWRLESVWP